MSMTAWVVLSLLVLFTLVLVLGSMILERKVPYWGWLHPPNDDDGCSLMDEEDDPDGQNTR